MFWLFRGIVDLFFWLYIATFCLPWVPGAPPGGSLGGVPGPMSAGQFSKHAHGCLGAWEGGPVVPGPPPLDPWGASRGLPGGGSRPNVCGPIPVRPHRFSHQNLCRFGCRFLVVLGSILGPSWSPSGRSWASLGSSRGLSLCPGYFLDVFSKPRPSEDSPSKPAVQINFGGPWGYRKIRPSSVRQANCGLSSSWHPPSVDNVQKN